MLIKILRKGVWEIIPDAAVMLVEDTEGNPVSIAGRTGPAPESFVVACLDNPEEFEKATQMLGIRRRAVMVNPLDSARDPIWLPRVF